jgi:rifampin ADP-ribosylating transferase
MAILDAGPYVYGMRADLQVGNLLTARFRSIYDDSLAMNHIY